MGLPHFCKELVLFSSFFQRVLGRGHVLGEVFRWSVFQNNAVVVCQVFQCLTVFIDAVGHGLGQRSICCNFQSLLLNISQIVVDIEVEIHVSVYDNLVQTLKVVVLQNFLEAKDRVRLRAAPFSRIDCAFFKCWQDVTTAHRNSWNTDVCVRRTHHARRCTETHLTEVIHRLDRLREPAQCFRTHRLQHETFDVHAHFAPQTVIKFFTTAKLEPAKERDVVHANTGTRNGSTKEVRRNVLAAPVVCPRKARFDKARVNRVHDVTRANNSAGRQHFDLHRTTGKLVDVFGEFLQHEYFVCRI